MFGLRSKPFGARASVGFGVYEPFVLVLFFRARSRSTSKELRTRRTRTEARAPEERPAFPVDDYSRRS